jgi:hypothetical protein
MRSAAEEAAGRPVAPMSIGFDWLGAGEAHGPAEVQITRATKTLVFVQGAWGQAGKRRLAAAGVFKIAQR